MKKFLLFLPLCLTGLILTGCGANFTPLANDVIDGLSVLQKVAQQAQASGLVPAGKTSDVVADTSTITNGLETLATGGAITTAQADAVAASFHSDGKTTEYVEIGSQVINGLVAITKSLIAQGTPAPAVQTAQVQYLVNAPVTVQTALTTPATSQP